MLPARTFRRCDGCGAVYAVPRPNTGRRSISVACGPAWRRMLIASSEPEKPAPTMATDL